MNKHLILLVTVSVSLTACVHTNQSILLRTPHDALNADTESATVESSWAHIVIRDMVHPGSGQVVVTDDYHCEPGKVLTWEVSSFRQPDSSTTGARRRDRTVVQRIACDDVLRSSFTNDGRVVQEDGPAPVAAAPVIAQRNQLDSRYVYRIQEEELASNVTTLRGTVHDNQVVLGEFFVVSDPVPLLLVALVVGTVVAHAMEERGE